MSERTDRLIGESYEIMRFADLPVPHQMALVWWMAFDGEGWEPFFDASLRNARHDRNRVRAVLMEALPKYVAEYGDEKFGVVLLPSEKVKDALMEDEWARSNPEFSNWAEYEARSSVPMVVHSDEDRWPVILSSTDEETLQDGWHRLDFYLRSGHADIPAVFYPGEHHLMKATPGMRC